QMAVDDAGFKVTPENCDRVGVYIGSGMGGLPAILAYHKVLLEKGPDRVSPFFVPMVIINLASGQVSMRLGARGPNSSAVTAGVMVLEELVSARLRGARIYAELVGYAMTADAYHITAPPEDGHGAIRCMSGALEDAGLQPEAIDYVNAHATSTMADRIETSAI